jgi:hypothetical protein
MAIYALRTVLISSILLLSGKAFALDFSLHGFGTVAGGIVAQDDIQILKYEDSMSYDSDSMIAVQLDSKLHQKLSFTVQLVSRSIENYDVETEWAYLNYQWSGNTDIKLGRIRNTLYFYSDQLEVGYAYHWIRPPDEVYSIPVSWYEGVRIDHRWATDKWDHQVNFYSGSYEQDTVVVNNPLDSAPNLDINSDADNILGISYQLDGENSTFRLAHFNFEVDFGSQGRTAVEQALVEAGYPEVADDLFVNGKYLRYYSAYANYRWAQCFIGAEFTYQDFERSNVADRKGFYATAGHYYNSQLLLHYTYATLETSPESGFSDPINPADPPVSPGAPSGADLINTVDNIVEAGRWEQTSHTLGFRYDLKQQNVALKLEYKHMNDDLAGGKRADLYMFAVDFVF